MTKDAKISFLESWKLKNIQMLIDSGLDQNTQGVLHGNNPLSFVTGLFFSDQLPKKEFLSYKKSSNVMRLMLILENT